jgi:hypothetical protein
MTKGNYFSERSPFSFHAIKKNPSFISPAAHVSLTNKGARWSCQDTELIEDIIAMFGTRVGNENCALDVLLNPLRCMPVK